MSWYFNKLKGGLGVLPQKKFYKSILKMVHFYVFWDNWEHKMDCNSLQYRAYYHAYHNYIGIDKCSGPPISPGPGEIPPPPPLSVGLMIISNAKDTGTRQTTHLVVTTMVGM